MILEHRISSILAEVSGETQLWRKFVEEASSLFGYLSSEAGSLCYGLGRFRFHRKKLALNSRESTMNACRC